MIGKRMAAAAVGLVISAAVWAGPGAGVATACDLTYWNIPGGNGCQYYTSGEANTVDAYDFYLNELMRSTWDTYDSIHFISTTSGGSWTQTYTCVRAGRDCTIIWDPDVKVGCHNHHTGTMWVNCHHQESS